MPNIQVQHPSHSGFSTGIQIRTQEGIKIFARDSGGEIDPTLYFRGVTSSDVLIKKDGTTLSVRLGDDSASASLECGDITTDGGITIAEGAPSTTTDTIYNSGGDLYFNGRPVDELSWIDYATNYATDPYLTGTVDDGEVYAYEYTGADTLYRLVPTGDPPVTDSFYSSWVDPTLSGLVASRGEL